MGAISGVTTVTNALDYVGPLYGISREDCPVTAAIGGLNGGEITTSMLFGWQTYDLRTAAQPAVLEGAAAPTAQGRTRTFAFNITQICHESIETTYSKQMYTGQYATTGSAHPGAIGIAGSNPVKSEHDWQSIQMLKQIANDVEYSVIRGTFSQPADSASARQTRGLLEAISTHTSSEGTAVTNATGEADTELFTKATHGLVDGDQIRVDSITGGTGSGLAAGSYAYVKKDTDNTFYLYSDHALTSLISYTVDVSDLDFTKLVEPTAAMFLDMMQDIWDDGGLLESATRVLICNSAVKRYLTHIFVDNNYLQSSRTIGGVAVDSILTDFGTLGIMLSAVIPKDRVIIASLEQCALVWGVHPEKGVRLFKEQIALTGSTKKEQFYGEYGLRYGNQRMHGKIDGLHFGYHPATP